METWIASNFKQNSDGGYVIFQSDEIRVSVDSTQIAVNFSGLNTPPTYAALSALPCAAQGWQQVFDQWKADGKVS